jgi:peptidyl-prolyl cis-trans isomerase B (cyclophilin B)
VTGSTDEPAPNLKTRAAKAKAQAAQLRAARARARRRIAIAVVAGVVVVIVAVVLSITLTGGTSSKTATPGIDTAALALTGTGTTACAYTPTGAGTAARDVGLPPSKGVASGSYLATITTNRGPVTIKLDGAKAPCTVNSFIYLAAKGYFGATQCHRLTTSGIFVLQCGDPTATGSGGPGYQFGDENLTGATYPAGTVAMANAGPSTNGSQFFLVYKDTQLSPAYTPFGTITSGMDVLNTIAAGGTDNSNGSGDGHPNIKVTISSVSVTRGS